MTENRFPKKELLILAIGEAIFVVFTIFGFFVVDLLNIVQFDFSYFKVTAGALLGAAVIILNFLLLSAAVNKAIDDFMALRGDKEFTDEEAESFAAKNSGMIQNAVKKSFIIRTISIAAILIVAFITKWFNPVATVIPIIAYQPIITWGNHIVESSKKIMARLSADKVSAEVATDSTALPENEEISDNVTDDTEENETAEVSDENNDNEESAERSEVNGL